MAHTVANEPHPHAEAQRAAIGLGGNEDIEIVDWDGPDDPENPCVSNRVSYGSPILQQLTQTQCRFNWTLGYKWTATLTTCFMYAGDYDHEIQSADLFL